MRNRQILWAIVFGSMLAITGCGDSGGDNSGDGGSSGLGGGGGGDFCTTLCEACGDTGAAQCNAYCDGFATLPGLEGCPNELNALAQCWGANGCDGSACEAEQNAWAACIVGQF